MTLALNIKSPCFSTVWIIALILFLLIPHSVQACTLSQSLSPDDWKMFRGHDSAFAQSNFNDRSWPVFGDSGANLNPHLWLRIRFKGDVQASHCGIRLGRIQSADEAYLNGQRIGQTGRIGEDWLDYASAEQKTRYYDLPSKLLTENNVLALRIYSPYLRPGAVLSDVEIGPADEMRLKAHLEDDIRRNMTVAVLSIILVGGLLALFSSLASDSLAQYRWLSLTFFLIAALYYFESLFVYEARMQQPLIKNVALVVNYGVLVTFMAYIKSLLGYLHRKYEWYVVVAPLFVLVMLELPLPLNWLPVVHLLWYASFIPAIALVSWRLYQAVNEGESDLLILLTGVTFLGGGFWLALMFRNFLPTGVDPVMYASILLILSLLMFFARRHAREHKLLLRLSAGVMGAQDEERRRIARELHDGMGQRIVATRLMLDALHTKNPFLGLQEPIATLRDSVQELRAMVYGLRPASLEDVDLITALKTYASRTTDLTGTLVEVESNVGYVNMDASVEEHVFRIFQEAINNAHKHGLASRVQVKCAANQTRFSMEVFDNGDGFTPQEAEGRGGVGLTAMSERARVCGGRLNIQSRPNEGTTVKVEIPLI